MKHGKKNHHAMEAVYIKKKIKNSRSTNNKQIESHEDEHVCNTIITKNFIKEKHCDFP